MEARLQDCKRNNEWYPCSGFETFLREMRLLAASLVFTFLSLVSPKKKSLKGLHIIKVFLYNFLTVKKNKNKKQALQLTR